MKFHLFCIWKLRAGKKKKSICMLVETRIHLTLTELRSLEFCYSPALHDIYTQSIRFREGGRQKKSGGWWGRRSNKKWLTTEQGLDIQQMGAKKVSMSCQIKLITQTFFKPSVKKSKKIIADQTAQKSLDINLLQNQFWKWAVQSEFISWKIVEKKRSQLRQIEGLIFLAAGLNVIF